MYRSDTSARYASGDADGNATRIRSERDPNSGRTRRGMSHRPGVLAEPPAVGLEPSPPAYSRAMRSQRSVVDYALARRAVLADLGAGRVPRSDICDAHPYPLRAARHRGEPAARRCPVCRRELLTLVHYVYGEQLGSLAGSARTPAQLRTLASEVEELSLIHISEPTRLGM